MAEEEARAYEFELGIELPNGDPAYGGLPVSVVAPSREDAKRRIETYFHELHETKGQGRVV